MVLRNLIGQDANLREAAVPQDMRRAVEPNSPVLTNRLISLPANSATSVLTRPVRNTPDIANTHCPTRRRCGE